jgi:hypothetical protein
MPHEIGHCTVVLRRRDANSPELAKHVNDNCRGQSCEGRCREVELPCGGTPEITWRPLRCGWHSCSLGRLDAT